MAALICTPTALLRSEARASSSRSTASAAKAGLSSKAFLAPRVNLSARPATGVARQTKLQVQAAATLPVTEKAGYTLPIWAEFELGMTPVYWDPVQPKAGEIMTMWYNPEYTSLRKGEYVAFNGGFNGPFMCGDCPRGMASKSRGDDAFPLYSIRIQLPRYAAFLEFGFTDGTSWDEGYVLQLASPPELAGKPMEFYQDGLAAEMAVDGACDAAIFPDDVPDAAYCKMPAGGGMSGQTCDLNLIPGCMDPISPNYNPMATVEDATCDLPPAPPAP